MSTQQHAHIKPAKPGTEAKQKSSLQRTSALLAPSKELPFEEQKKLNMYGQGKSGAANTFAESRFAHDFSRVQVHNTTPVTLQTKLTVGQAGDQYEQEADRAADSIMRMPNNPINNGAATKAPRIQQFDSASRGGLRRQPDDEEEQKKKVAQGSHDSNATADMPGQNSSLADRDKAMIDAATQKPRAKPDNYGEAGEKAAEALMKTDAGKKIVEFVTEQGKEFFAHPEGKVITGVAAAGAVAVLLGTHSPLPAQLPQIPLDFIKPGLSVKLTYKGPVDKPTEAALTFSFTPKSEAKKPTDKNEKFRTETERIRKEQEKFRRGLLTPEQRAAEDAATFNMVARRRDPLGIFQGPGFGTSPILKPKKDKKDEDETLMRKEDNTASPAVDVPDVPLIVYDVLHSPSQPLDPSTRTFMESRFGHDFSGVRVHTDARAAESARGVNAQAYTVGRDMVFEHGKYSPATSEGRRLLVHELTHVVQQGRGGASPTLDSHAFHERDASSAANAIDAGPMQVPVYASTGVGLARQENKPMSAAHAGGAMGEQDAAFALGREGFVVITGPSGAGGHKLTEHGLDMVAYNPKTGEVWIVDNKASGGRGKIREASAITTNLASGLTTAINEVKAAPDFEYKTTVLQKLDSALGAAKANQALPDDVKLKVTNAGGYVTGISGDLTSKNAPQKIEFYDVVGKPTIDARKKDIKAAKQAGVSPGRPVTVSTPAVGAGTQGEVAKASGKPAPTATVGTPDMHPIEVGGPSQKGEAIAGGIMLGLQGINFVLNWINNSIQAKKVHKALAAVEPGIAQDRVKNPAKGVLLVFYYTRRTDPSGESLIQPGAEFTHLETFNGLTRDEAVDQWHSTPAIRQGVTRNQEVETQEVWIPPLKPAGITAIRTPFKKVAVGTFAGKAVLQDVEWGGITGFDDEGQSSLSIEPGFTPKFLILELPAKLNWINGTVLVTTDIPVEQRAAAEGGSIPVVNLDPVIPFSNVSAACVFPADDATAVTFQTAPETHDNLGQIKRLNFSEARWVRPENIKVLQRL